MPEIPDQPIAPAGADGGPAVDQATAQAYWGETSRLMWIMLVIWFLASFLIHFFAPTLNTIKILGFPLGFYMAAQGSLIIFVVQLFWFATAQNAIDKKYGVAEDE